MLWIVVISFHVFPASLCTAVVVSQWRLSEIGLESYFFVLLSQ